MPDSCICATSASSWFFTEPTKAQPVIESTARSPKGRRYEGMNLLDCSRRSSLLFWFGAQLRIHLQVADRLCSRADAGTQLVRRYPGRSTSGDQEIPAHTGT